MKNRSGGHIVAAAMLSTCLCSQVITSTGWLLS